MNDHHEDDRLSRLTWQLVQGFAQRAIPECAPEEGRLLVVGLAPEASSLDEAAFTDEIKLFEYDSHDWTEVCDWGGHFIVSSLIRDLAPRTPTGDVQPGFTVIAIYIQAAVWVREDRGNLRRVTTASATLGYPHVVFGDLTPSDDGSELYSNSEISFDSIALAAEVYGGLKSAPPREQPLFLSPTYLQRELTREALDVLASPEVSSSADCVVSDSEDEGINFRDLGHRLPRAELMLRAPAFAYAHDSQGVAVITYLEGDESHHGDPEPVITLAGTDGAVNYYPDRDSYTVVDNGLSDSLLAAVHRYRPGRLHNIFEGVAACAESMTDDTREFALQIHAQFILKALVTKLGLWWSEELAGPPLDECAWGEGDRELRCFRMLVHRYYRDIWSCDPPEDWEEDHEDES